MDKKLIDAIQTNDFITIRDMLKNRLLMDHDVNGGIFKECWNECEKAGIIQNILQPHDGRELSNELTEKNYNTLVGQLSTNFSEIRLNKILFLAKEIWSSEQTENMSSQNREMKSSSSNTTYDNEDGRVVGERIIEEREIPNEKTRDTSERVIHSNEKNDSNLGVVLAVAAVATVAVIAGVVLLG